MNKNKVLFEAKRGDITLKLMEKEMAKVGAYSLGRIMKIKELPLKPDELRFLAQKKIKKWRI